MPDLKRVRSKEADGEEGILITCMHLGVLARLPALVVASDMEWAEAHDHKGDER